MKWSNRETSAVFRHLLAEWGAEWPEIAREWAEDGPAAAALGLAEQLCADYAEMYDSWDQAPDSQLVCRMVRLGLRRVDWFQVAQRALAEAARGKVGAP